MVYKCCVPACRSGYKSQWPCDTSLSFHSFPLTNTELRAKWIASVYRDDFQPTRYSRVCSRHFSDEDFVIFSKDSNVARRSQMGRVLLTKRYLKDDAVPSLFLKPELNQEKPLQTENDTAATTNPSMMFNTNTQPALTQQMAAVIRQQQQTLMRQLQQQQQQIQAQQAAAAAAAAQMPQYKLQQITHQNKYAQLLSVIDDLGRDIRPSYAGSRSAQERLKKGIAFARQLVNECIVEAEINAKNS